MPDLYAQPESSCLKTEADKKESEEVSEGLLEEDLGDLSDGQSQERVDYDDNAPEAAAADQAGNLWQLIQECISLVYIVMYASPN